VEEGSAYLCTLSDSSNKTPSQTETYTKTLTVTMGGNDITSSVVTKQGSDINQSFTINIPKVTGNIIITAKGSSASKYQTGDVNLYTSIDINDATVIQKYLVGLKTLTSEQLTLGDVNSDGVVDINDATRIQKYIVGLSTFASSAKSVGSVGAAAANSTGASKTDLQTLMSEVESYLSDKYTYSSYDQYMAVKKEYRYCKNSINSFTDSDISSNYSLLNEKYKTLKSIAGEVSEKITVYFKNTSSWSSVYAYYWQGSDNNTWPGTTMTKVKDNIYKISVGSNYTNIIFSNGTTGTKTGDLTIQGDNYIYDFSTKSWSKYSG
jgi:hypothetical protein